MADETNLTARVAKLEAQIRADGDLANTQHAAILARVEALEAAAGLGQAPQANSSAADMVVTLPIDRRTTPRNPMKVIEQVLAVIPADQVQLRSRLQSILDRHDFLLLPEQYSEVFRQGAVVLGKFLDGAGEPAKDGWQARVEAIWFDKEP